ncbi:unnamed protein product [Mucor hiemalis]
MDTLFNFDTSSYFGARSEVSSLVAKLEQLSINLVKLNENQKQNTRYSPTNGNNSYGRVSTCFYCNEPGHKKYDCPKFNENAPPPATGSNATPVNTFSGKDTERLIHRAKVGYNNPQCNAGGGKIENGAVNYVKTVCDEVIESDVNEVFMNGVKRRAINPPSVDACKFKKKARRFPVKLKKNKAGISLAEWISMDKEAASEVVDGIRYLRERTIKKKKPVVAIVTQNSVPAAMEIDTDAIVNEVRIGNSSDEESSYDEYDTSTYTSGEEQESSSVSEASSSQARHVYEESDPGFSDTESVYRLEKMKAGSPLRGVISIKGHDIECIHDTGASVPVIGVSLVKKLGLVPNGDKLNLITFNQAKGAPFSSNIVMDVPISVNGKIRPEHMCIEENGDKELCLLGIPWFKIYGVNLDLQRGLILIPTSDGNMKIKGFTRHSTDGNSKQSLNQHFETLNKAKKIDQVQVEQKYTNTFADDLLETEFNEANPIKKVNGILGEVKYDESNMTIGVAEPLAGIIEKYKYCFSEISGLSKIKGYMMDIHLIENAIPVRNSAYRLSWSDQEILDDYVQEMLDLDLIERSTGVWTSSLFLLEKKESNSKRVVADLRRANKQIVKTNFPIATVAELTEATCL